LLREAAGAVAVVGSGRSSVEEQFLTRRLAESLGATTHLVSRTAQGDGLLISADRNPNVRGALVTGLINALPSARLGALAEAIDAGRVRAVVSVGEDLAAAGLTPAQLARVAVVYLGTHANATSAVARVTLPTLSVFEKGGCFVNQQFRLQRFLPAVPGPVGAADDLAVLSRLIGAAGASVPGELHAVWRELATAVPDLQGLSFATLSDEGHSLDASPFAALPFVEGETLHHKPATR
jgi:NADH-quinone oxidoreductase subunit G